jgi:CheY-like chemotaxis protein
LCHVLIIEDEALIALDLEGLLQRAGATSFSFATSEGEAVAAAREHRPDIITSDVTLLEGTGPAAVAIIRSTMGRIPVLYISGTAPDCCGSDPLTRALRKPLDRPAAVIAFQELRHLSCA